MMGNPRYITGKDSTAYRLKFFKLCPEYLYIFLCLGMGFLLISCTTVPKQTYLPKTPLTGVKKVAVIASARAPVVHYSMMSQYAGASIILGLLSPFLGLTLSAAEAGIRSGIDSQHASKVKEHVDLNEIEYKAAMAFIKPLQEGACFQAIEYVKAKDLDNSRLLAAGFDAVIRLSLRKISLERAPSNDIKLCAFMQGQMENLVSRKTIWDREEAVQSTEYRSLEYYEKNGIKEMDALLETACGRLAFDFVYR